MLRSDPRLCEAELERRKAIVDAYEEYRAAARVRDEAAKDVHVPYEEYRRLSLLAEAVRDKRNVTERAANDKFHALHLELERQAREIRK
jgi:hypothetical protein